VDALADCHGDADAHGYEHAYQHADAHAHSDCYGDGNAAPDPDRDQYAHADQCPIADIGCARHTESDSDTVACANQYGYAHGNAYA
jgi:hypothetical protein